MASTTAKKQASERKASAPAGAAGSPPAEAPAAPTWIHHSLSSLVVPVSSLRLDPENARLHGTKNLATIKASLGRFGQMLPLVAHSDGLVIIGNGRLQTILENDLPVSPGGKTRARWDQVAVLRFDGTAAEARALGLVDNRAGELAEWNFETLSSSLRLLQDDVDLASLGWEEFETKHLLETNWDHVGKGIAPEPQPLPPELYRPTHEPSKEEATAQEPWRKDWWGMPAFEQRDALPSHRITVNFMTEEDVKAFAKAAGINVTISSDSCWFPPQERLGGGDFVWTGPKTPSKYPVCIPSKGRSQYQTTGHVLDRLGIDHLFFVEETEADAYISAVGEKRVVVMPFHDLGQGSIPARNFIWDWAKKHGHRRHWTVDDNLRRFVRCHQNRRLGVMGGGLFRAMEDFVDRYENIAMAGPHHQGFVPDRVPGLTPFILNSRVYSCILLDTTLPHRWRGRYNEDTDLSLRLLKDGYVTLLFRALCMAKSGTSQGAAGRTKGAMPGGNADNVYIDGDHRKAFAESLRAQHPDVVKVVWRFKRWHHLVDYSPFAGNTPRLKPGVVPIPVPNEYGMKLTRAKAGSPQEQEAREQELDAQQALDLEGEDTDGQDSPEVEAEFNEASQT